ncbi:unnamed protein product [Toxocara canis]|uniref:PH domain-containing protein n=1 Tax=Toxocara canis TaxID=6265 RepID=A0A183UM54_TOXCA|nr:unnamed protein product [Toxocara canis]
MISGLDIAAIGDEKRRFVEHSNENQEDEETPWNGLTVLVHAKRRNRIGWRKSYYAKISRNYIVLHQPSKRDNTPNENIIVDIVQVSASSNPNRDMAANGSSNDQETLFEGGDTNSNVDTENKMSDDNEKEGLEEEEEDRSVACGSLSEPIKRNLDLCKMGFALSAELSSDEMQCNGNLMRLQSDQSCEHPNAVNKCDCEKLYENAVELFGKTNDLLQRLQVRQNNLNLAYEQIMEAISKDHKNVDKLTKSKSKVEAVCLHKRKSISSKPSDYALLPDEMDTLLSEVDLNETESAECRLTSSGRSRFYVDVGKYNPTLSNN